MLSEGLSWAMLLVVICLIGAVEDRAVIPCLESIAPSTNAIKVLVQEHPLVYCYRGSGASAPRFFLIAFHLVGSFIVDPIMLHGHMNWTSGQPCPRSGKQQSKRFVIEDLSGVSHS